MVDLITRSSLAARQSVVTVLICHPEPLMAEAIAAAVEAYHVSWRATCTSSLTGVLSALRSSVDIAAIIDRDDEDIVELFEAVRHRGAVTPIVVVIEPADVGRAALLLESGAAGIVPAARGTAELCEALDGARRGSVAIDGAMREGVLEELRFRRQWRRAAQEHLARLSPSDVAILRLLCDGLTVTHIARRLALSPHTVRGRIRIIGTSLNVTGQLRIAAAGRRLFAAALPPSGVLDI